MSAYNTKKVLAAQDHASAFKNVMHDILSQLQLHLEITIACGCRVCDPHHAHHAYKQLDQPGGGLAELGLTGTGAGTLAKILVARFPFITPRTAEDIAVSSRTLRDVIDSVLVKVGPLNDNNLHAASAHPARVASHDPASEPNLFPASPGQ